MERGEDAPATLSNCHEVVGFGGRDGKGLFYDYVFAGFEEGFGEGVVGGIGSADNDEVNLGVGKNVLKGSVDLCGRVVEGGIVGGGWSALEDAV